MLNLAIKRKRVIRYDVTCDCCGKQATIEKVDKEETKADGIARTMRELQREAYQNQIKPMDVSGISANDKIQQLIHSGYMEKIEEIWGGQGEVPNDWFVLDDGRVVCCEECLIKLLDKDKEAIIIKYREKLLNKLRK